MKIYIFIIIVLYSFNLLSNEIEVIELHENKSLDQIVLENVEVQENEISTNIESNENEENENEDVSIENININKQSYLLSLDIDEIEKILDNSKNIKSAILLNEFTSLLEYNDYDFSVKKNRLIFFNIVNYFYNSGNISKAYEIVMSRDLDDHENSDLYNIIKINYLLSTFQLEEACFLKNEFVDTIKLKNNLLEKVDIFCLILEGKNLEAELINSILIETETALDENFQYLYEKIRNNDYQNEINKLIFDKKNNIEFMYLYSAMARIAEIPLDQNFLEIDAKNLSIPIILNQSSPIELRIKAANESFIYNIISIDSLAALYQSVDFDSDQLNNPEKTLKQLSDNTDLLMAYYYQLINIQIFPSERLQALINFWKFAKKNDLELIAYSLSYNIIQSINLESSNIDYSADISAAYIYNNDFENALKWIEFYENSMGPNEKVSYTRILLDLYSTTNTEDLLTKINNNLQFFENLNMKNNEELIYILLTILGNNENNNLSKDFNKIYDDRLMPSLFIIKQIEEAIKYSNSEQFLIYVILSLNNLNWNEVHPQHLQLVLEGFNYYEGEKIMKNLVLEIFKNFKLL